MEATDQRNWREVGGVGGGGVSRRSMRAMKRQIDTDRETDTDGDTEITIFELVTVFERGMLSMSVLSAYGECILTLSQRRYKQKLYAGGKRRRKKVQDRRTRCNM